MIKKTLYFGHPARLSLSEGQLVIERPGAEKVRRATEVWFPEDKVTRPIEDIGVMILDNPQLTLTSQLMEALLENNCALITCDGRHLPVGLLLPLYGNTTQNERFRQQMMPQCLSVNNYGNKRYGLKYSIRRLSSAKSASKPVARKPGLVRCAVVTLTIWRPGRQPIIGSGCFVPVKASYATAKGIILTPC